MENKMDKKDYTMILLSAALLISIGLDLMPDPTHTCDSRELKAHCFDLSPTGKTCYTLPGKIGGKRCLDVWDEIIIEPQYSGIRQWSCIYGGCTIK